MDEAKTAPRLLVAVGAHDLRALVSAIGRGQGFSVTPVSSGSQAIEILATNDFDVVMLDAVLPYVSGEDVLAYYRARYPAASNVIVAAAKGEKVPKDLRGVYSVVAKPLDVGALASLINDCAHPQHAA